MDISTAKREFEAGLDVFGFANGQKRFLPNARQLGAGLIMGFDFAPERIPD